MLGAIVKNGVKTMLFIHPLVTFWGTLVANEVNKMCQMNLLAVTAVPVPSYVPDAIIEQRLAVLTDHECDKRTDELPQHIACFSIAVYKTQLYVK